MNAPNTRMFVDGPNLWNGARSYGYQNLGKKVRVNWDELVKRFTPELLEDDEDGEAVEEETTGKETITVAVDAYLTFKSNAPTYAFKEHLAGLGVETHIRYVKATLENSKLKSWITEITIAALSAAYEGTEHIIIVSGNGEFAPVIEAIKALGKRVTVVGFPNLLSHRISEAAEVEYLDAEILEEVIRRNRYQGNGGYRRDNGNEDDDS